MKFGKKLWLCIIITEIMLLYIVGFIYSQREPVEINYSQGDLLYNNNEKGFYIDNRPPPPLYNHSCGNSSQRSVYG